MTGDAPLCVESWWQLPPGQHRARCPCCPKQGKSVSITISAPGLGVAMCHRCRSTWNTRAAKPASPTEQRRILAQAREVDARREQRQLQVAREAQERWAAARPAPAEHAYLHRKGVEPHYLRIDGQGALLVPLRDVDGHLWTLQRIAPDGQKRFLAGSRVRGCFYAARGSTA